MGYPICVYENYLIKIIFFTSLLLGRRSVSALGERRTSMSANSSPVKSRLKQELLNAVKKADDDESIAIQVNLPFIILHIF